MDSEAQKYIDIFNTNVDQIRTVFAMGSDDFNRAYLILVAGFVHKARDLELGKKMVKSIPREYFTAVMPKQMESDPLFCTTMCKLAELFRDAKLVEPPTYKAPRHLIMKAAKA